MRRICEECGLTYDDFDHLTVCPHQGFPISPAAAAMLREQGVPLQSVDGDPRKPTEAELREFGTGGCFADWLKPMTIRVVISQDHGQWYAKSEEFGLVGAGASELAALKSLGRILRAFLHDYYERGLPFDAARGTPPPPPRARVPSPFGLARLIYRQVAQRLSASHRRSFPLR